MILKYKKRSLVSKILDVYYKLQIFVCFDLGYLKWSVQWRRFIKLLCFVLATSNCFTACFLNNFSNSIILSWYISYLINYLACVYSLLLWKQDTTFAAFKMKLEEIDIKIMFDRIDSVERRELLVYVTIIFFHLVLTIYYYLTGNLTEKWWLSVIYTIISADLDVVISTYAFLFYAISCRLKKFASNLNENIDIENKQRIYKEIAVLTDNVVKSYNSVFLVTLLCNIYNLMCGMYFAVLLTVANNEMIIVTLFKTVGLTELLKLTITLAPAVFATKLSTEIEELKLKLHDRLLFEKDAEIKDKIKSLICYVEARPLKFKVYEVIPLDASLLGTVFNFCATYLIVIIQFSHII